LDRLVGRVDIQDARPDPAGTVFPPLFFVILRELFQDQRSLVRAVQPHESLTELAERLLVLGSVVEADLEVLQRPLVIVPLDINIDGVFSDLDVVRIEVDNPLGDLRVVVEAALLLEHVRRLPKVLQGVVVAVLFGVGLGELDAQSDVLGVEADEFLEHLDLFPALALFLVALLRATERLGGILEPTQTVVGFADIAMELRVLRVEPECLFIDGDRLLIEVSPGVSVADLAVRCDRSLLLVDAGVQVGEFQAAPYVVGVVFDELLEFLDGSTPVPRPNLCLGGGTELFAVDAHGDDPETAVRV